MTFDGRGPLMKDNLLRITASKMKTTLTMKTTSTNEDNFQNGDMYYLRVYSILPEENVNDSSP